MSEEVKAQIYGMGNIRQEAIPLLASVLGQAINEDDGRLVCSPTGEGLRVFESRKEMDGAIKGVTIPSRRDPHRQHFLYRGGFKVNVEGEGSPAEYVALVELFDKEGVKLFEP